MMEETADSKDKTANSLKDLADDNDSQLKIDSLSKLVAQLENENKKSAEEFGAQRAQMKVIYLQKEEELKKQAAEQEQLKEEIKRLQTELDETRSQLTAVSLETESLESQKRTYQDEISSLQQIVNETIDESTLLTRKNEALEAELAEIKGQSTRVEIDKDGAPLAAAGAMIQTFARKVTNQISSQLNSDSSAVSVATNTSSSFLSPTGALTESLEESMRKVNKYAKEDSEVLRSLLVPLEEEIELLKDKLREMDQEVNKYKSELSCANQELNKYKGENGISSDAIETTTPIVHDLTNSTNSTDSLLSMNHTNSQNENMKKLESSPKIIAKIGSATSVASSGVCNMCENYEAQLVAAQERSRDLEKQLCTLERYKEELSKETAFRKDMEEKWNEKKEEHKLQIQELQKKVEEADKSLKELKHIYSTTKSEVTQRLSKLDEERRQTEARLNHLQRENENLVGKHSKRSSELQSEMINLPDVVPELQEMLLRRLDDLIAAKVGQEKAEEMVENLRYEANMLREQLESAQKNQICSEQRLQSTIHNLESNLHRAESEKQQLSAQLKELEARVISLQQETDDLKLEYDKAVEARGTLEYELKESRKKITALQIDLQMCERTQKDFVQLSQSLQQELEKIRESDNQVRWEHDEDVDECHNCKAPFSVTKRRQHCRHCGRIFCTACLSHQVKSGPHQRPSKVCGICHTLLDRETAPFFSTDPPIPH
nr:PREDICTED: rab GTPase-binding effector protein 1 isoform X1 [Bemisia tabaci]